MISFLAHWEKLHRLNVGGSFMKIRRTHEYIVVAVIRCGRYREILHHVREGQYMNMNIAALWGDLQAPGLHSSIMRALHTTGSIIVSQLITLYTGICTLHCALITDIQTCIGLVTVGQTVQAGERKQTDGQTGITKCIISLALESMITG